MSSTLHNKLKQHKKREQNSKAFNREEDKMWQLNWTLHAHCNK